MCNPELTDSLAVLLNKMHSHTNELRLKFSDAHEEYRAGNLDESSLGALNQAIHQIEADVASFEKLAESF